MSIQMMNGVEVTLPPLTDAQQQAVFAPQGPILADSVPGSGKTRTITCRLAHLAGLNPADSILAITFTKGAAAEMAVRAKAMIKTTQALPKVTHFHSFAYHLLQDLWGVKKLPVVTPERILGKLGSIHQDLTGEVKADPKTIENFAQLISRAKSTGLNRVKDSEEINCNFIKWSNDSSLIMKLWDKLDDWYQEHSLLDFDDLLNRSVEEINRVGEWRQRLHEKYRHILVDEFQDINPPQWALVRSIVENRVIDVRMAGKQICSPDFDWNGRSLLACGDGDQSIYGFRSADITNILQFPDVYQNSLIVELNTNYRSTSTINACANRLIANNQKRRPKQIEATRAGGSNIALVPSSSEEEQTRRVSRLLLELYDGKRRIAVLSRHHDTLCSVREACETIGVPTNSTGGVPFTETRQLQMVRRWLTAAFNLHDNETLLASMAEAGENETWKRRAEASRSFKISLWELVWQQGDLTEDEAEFFQFILRLNQLVRNQRYSDAVKLCFDRTGFFNEVCEGRDPVRMGRLLDALRLIKQIEEAEGELKVDSKKLLDFFQTSQNSETNQSISLMTIHASKGLEFDVAIIVDCTDGVMPQHESDDQEEERRLFYVAVTRAIDRLVLCFNINNPSRFLREITDFAGASADFIRLDEN